MSTMKPLCAALLVSLMMSPRSLARAQEDEVITVTGMYSSSPYGEYQEILRPCDSSEIWDIATTSPAFPALSQVYKGLDETQLSKSGALFVEVRGRYRAYDDPVHTDGVFEVTEFVRHSTAAADMSACDPECEALYGANSPTCLAQEDGQCGSTRNSCVAGHPFDHDGGDLADTATEYRWVCLGLYGGDNSVVCTAPKAVAPPNLRGAVDVVSQLNSAPLTLYGWAYNQSDTAANIPVEIYVGGARETGTLAATITADQPRPDVNTAYSITGDHGYEWPVPTQYQRRAQDFYVYALDQSPNPTARTQLNLTPLHLLAPSHADYCKNHGPCRAGQGDCEPGECQSGLTCAGSGGWLYGWGASVDVCQASTGSTVHLGHMNYCKDHGPCAAGQGDCDSDAECQSGLSCVERGNIDVCVATLREGM